METQENKKAVVQSDDKKKIVYKVGEQEVILTRDIVRNLLAKGNGKVSDAEVVQFMCTCQANTLDPFTGDAWLVKYDDRTPATMVTSRDAFMRRAEASGKTYEGYESGVIVLREKQVVELEGAFFLPTDQLVGGWAKVYRSDRKFPTVQKVRLQEYNTGKSNWASKPATMIQKVAEAQAFRKAFPLRLAGLFTQDELPEYQPQPGEEQHNEKPAPRPVTFTEEAVKEVAPQPEPAADPKPEVEEPKPQEDPALVKAGLVDPAEGSNTDSLFKV